MGLWAMVLRPRQYTGAGYGAMCEGPQAPPVPLTGVTQSVHPNRSLHFVTGPLYYSQIVLQPEGEA